MITIEIHPSMTGLESAFEEELAHADRKYLDPDFHKFDSPRQTKPSRETKESRLAEESMHLHS